MQLFAPKGKERTVTYARQIISTHPRKLDIDADVRSRCIDACLDCAQACTACADACLAEDTVAHLRRCITLCVDCADICEATGRVVSRMTEFDRELARGILEACVTSCSICAPECERHAKMGMKHCEICEEACRRCEEACRALVSLL
jgi:hypothetical protein